MDLIDLASKQQLPTTSNRTEDLFAQATSRETTETDDDGVSSGSNAWINTAQEIWSAPQATPPGTNETFDATPPPTVALQGAGEAVPPWAVTTDNQPGSAPAAQAKPAEGAAKPAVAPPTDGVRPGNAPTTGDAPAAAKAGDAPTPVAKPAGPMDLQKSLQWLERAVELSDKTDTRQALSRIVEGQNNGINLIEVLTQPGLSADRRKVLSDMNLRLHAEKWQEYERYLDPALARAELALAKIVSGDDKLITEGEKNLVAAVAMRPELQFNEGFQRKVLTAYQQMENGRKNKGLPPWNGELKPETAASTTSGAVANPDESMGRANQAYADKGIKEALPHFEAAIRTADGMPHDKLSKELTELFCRRLTIERTIIAKELRDQNVDTLLVDRNKAREDEWSKYRDYLSPASTRVNTAMAMISSGDAELLRRGKTLLGEAIAKRPELEFDSDYQEHLKKAFESHHKNKPTTAQAPGQDVRPPDAGAPGAGNPNRPDEKFEVGYKKIEPKDLGKGQTDLENDKEVSSYLADSVTGPLLTAAVLYLGYRVAKGRIERIRARRAAAAEAKENGGTEANVGESKGPGGEKKPGETRTGDTTGDVKPGEAKPGDARTGTPRPGETPVPGDVKPGESKPGDTTRSGDTKPPGEAKPGDPKPEDIKAKPAQPDAIPGEAKPAQVDNDRVPLSERIKAAAEDIQPGLKKLMQMAIKEPEKAREYRRLVNDLIELDKSGKLNTDMRFYLKKGGTSFLKDGGADHLKEMVEQVAPKQTAKPAAAQRPPLSMEDLKARTDAVFDAAKPDIKLYEQEAMVRQAKRFTNEILSKYFPGVEATEVFAGNEGLAVRLNDGTILKFRPNSEWDASWGYRDLDMPMLAIDGGEPRPMQVGEEGWVVYRQPFGERPDAKQVQEFLNSVKRLRGDTGDFGKALDAASRQLGKYRNPTTGRVEVRCFDYGALEAELSGEYDFGEQDVLDLKKPAATPEARPEGTRVEPTLVEGPKPEVKPGEAKPEGPARADVKPAEPKPSGPATGDAKPAEVKPAEVRPTVPAERPRTTTGGSAESTELRIETSPFESGAQGEPRVERPASAMDAGKMIEIKLPGGIIARMAKADAPKFLERVEKDFKTNEFGKVLDELIADKGRTEEEKRELRDLKERWEKLPVETKEECKAEFFRNIRTQLGIETEVTEQTRSRSSRVGRALVVGGGVLAIGILSAAVLRSCMQKEASNTYNRVNVEFIKKP